MDGWQVCKVRMLKTHNISSATLLKDMYYILDEQAAKYLEFESKCVIEKSFFWIQELPSIPNDPLRVDTLDWGECFTSDPYKVKWLTVDDVEHLTVIEGFRPDNKPFKFGAKYYRHRKAVHG